MKIPSSLTDRAACLSARANRILPELAAASALLAVRVWLAARALRAQRPSPPALAELSAPHARRALAALGALRALSASHARRALDALRPAPALCASHARRGLGALRGGLRAVLAGVVFLARRPAFRRAVQRAGRGPSGRLTGRGGVAVMFAACFAGLLAADWANWAELANAVFFMASSLTAYYVRPGNLLPVAVSPPLLFFVAMALEKLLIASGSLAALEGTLVMLADAAPWLLAGTALTLAIALLRGLSREVRALVLELRAQ